MSVGKGFASGFGGCLGVGFAIFFVVVILPIGCLMIVGSKSQKQSTPKLEKNETPATLPQPRLKVSNDKTDENPVPLPKHKYVASFSGRSQIRAVIDDYPLREQQWKEIAVNLCHNREPHVLVMFFDNETVLNEWDGSGLLKDQDWKYWLCRIAVDNGVAGDVKVAQKEDGNFRDDIIKQSDEADVSRNESELSQPEHDYLSYRLQNTGKIPLLHTGVVGRPIQIGDIGVLTRNSSEHTFRVDQIIDNDEMLIFGNEFWIKGVRTTNLVDNSTVDLGSIVFVVTQNKQYATVLGASKTVRCLTVLDTDNADRAFEEKWSEKEEQERKAEEKIRKLEQERLKREEEERIRRESEIEAAKWRIWTSVDGKYTIEAKFLKYTFGEVHLEKKDGSVISIKKEQLSSQDWEWIKRR